MSLVAYAASSDDESDCESENVANKIEPVKIGLAANINGHISDDEEDFAPVDVTLKELKKPTAFALSLPKPKNLFSSQSIAEEELDEQITPAFAKLPMPKNIILDIEEEDDEFLRKKANSKEKPPPPPTVVKGPVKISIPSLNDFKDVEKDLANRAKHKAANPEKIKGCGLLGLLPKAKSEQTFAKSTTTKLDSSVLKGAPVTKAPTFIPDTVKNRRPAHNTEGVDRNKAMTTKTSTVNKPPVSLVACSDSEDSDDAGDFFSLNTAEDLPEVSTNEINVMVAKRAAKMAEAATNYLKSIEVSKSEAELEQQQQNEEALQQAQKRYHENQQQQLNADEMQALVGSSAKRRRRNQQTNIQVMDISSEQVLPDRDEWMRTALASSTSYQPTGVLVDEEPVAGTRRKHQITYLAHKAKANEAELQAMWSANRQNRRATQSKYGF